MYSKIRNEFSSSAKLSTILLNPIKALIFGNVRLILFSALLIAPTWFFFLSVDHFLGKVLEHFLSQHSLVNASSIALSGFVWSIAIPILLVAIVVPVRVLWFKKRITFGSMFAEIMPSLQRAYLSSLLSLVGIFLLGAALLFAINFIGTFLLADIAAEELRLLLIGLSTLFGLLAFRVFANLLVLPFLTTGSGLSLRDALASIPQVLRKQHLSLLMILTLFAAAIVSVNFLFHGAFWQFEKLIPYELTCFAGIVWYMLGCITTFCLASAESANANQLRYLRELASPIVIKHHDVRKKSRTKKEPKRPRIKAPTVDTGRFRAHRKTTAISAQEMQLLLSR